MKRVQKRLGWRGLFGLASLAVLAAVAVWTAGLQDRPAPIPLRQAGLNILLITVDTLRADAPGFAGGRAARTPAIDRLAAGGATFANAYAHNTMTLPSHANILSGRFPFEHGIRDNAGARFPASVETIATILKNRGYRTGAFVSAFPLESRFGLARGFDVYDDRFADAARPAFLEQERQGDASVSLARRWIDSDDGRPYFCWVHIYEPHFPYKPDYATDVSAADTALAPLLEPILAEGSAGKTLVVFTSDHGEALGEHGEATHGIFAYEATLRVPLVLYAPRLWPSRTIQTPAAHVDLMPTILDAIRVAPPSRLPGRSLMGAIAGERVADRPLYFEALSGMLGRGWAPLRGVITGRFKYIELPIPELYDLARDPSERENLAPSSSERVRAMRAALDRWPAPTGPRAPNAAGESTEVGERLRSLGYVGAAATPKDSYTAADDPKNLIALDSMLQEAIGLYLDGQLQPAIAKCRELVARRPQMAVSLLHLAHLEREAGNLAGGIDALRRALALNPRDSQTAALLGAYLTEAQQPAEAAGLLEPFAARADADPEVLVAHAVALARLGRTDEGLRVLERARALDPTSGAVLMQIGTVQLMAGRTGEARGSFERALALNPSLARAYSSLGAIAAESGDSATALARWREAVALDPGEFRTVLAVSVGLVQRGRAAEARPYFEFFAASAPESRYAPDIARVRAWLVQSHAP